MTKEQKSEHAKKLWKKVRYHIKVNKLIFYGRNQRRCRLFWSIQTNFVSSVIECFRFRGKSWSRGERFQQMSALLHWPLGACRFVYFALRPRRPHHQPTWLCVPALEQAQLVLLANADNDLAIVHNPDWHLYGLPETHYQTAREENRNKIGPRTELFKRYQTVLVRTLHLLLPTQNSRAPQLSEEHEVLHCRHSANYSMVEHPIALWVLAHQIFEAEQAADRCYQKYGQHLFPRNYRLQLPSASSSALEP